MLAEYATFNPEQKKFIARMKEPTNVLLKPKNLSPLVVQGKTAAFRISSHPWVKKLFANFDKPLVATSANASGEFPIQDPRKYKEVFNKKAELIDAAVFTKINKKRKGSQIVDLTVRPFKVVRE